jgi:hypothetical protein
MEPFQDGREVSLITKSFFANKFSALNMIIRLSILLHLFFEFGTFGATISGMISSATQINQSEVGKSISDSYKGIEGPVKSNDLAWLSKITGKDLKPADLIDGFPFLQVP